MFQLHERLSNDLIFLKDLELSKLFLYPDSDNPWIVLVPKRADIVEIDELSTEDQALLMKEISFFSREMKREFKAKKMNVGALGNMVAQLHIHIICRYENDKAWPGSIWGYDKGEDKNLIEEFSVKVKDLALHEI